MISDNVDTVRGPALAFRRAMNALYWSGAVISCVALVLIFGFIEIWNDFFLAFLLLRKPELQTIPLGLVSFFQQYDSLWNLYFAALMITTLPVIIVFLLMQRQFIAGLTAGAVKG